jgi:hypothetical protein
MVRLAAFLAASLLPTTVLATPALCSDRTLSEVRSIAGLPHEVQILLGSERRGAEGIADRMERFNATDVIKDGLPMRRFTIAGVSSDCIVVGVEHGGRGYNVERWVYRRDSAAWTAERVGGFWRKPQSVQILLGTGDF